MYLAKSLHYGERSLDDDEFLNVDLMPLSELDVSHYERRSCRRENSGAVMRVWNELNSEQ